MVPHSCLEKADGRTRKNHNLKFRHIGYNMDPYGQSFFPKCISAWNGLAQEIAEANTLDLFKSKFNNDREFLILKLCWIVIHHWKGLENTVSKHFSLQF